MVLDENSKALFLEAYTDLIRDIEARRLFDFLIQLRALDDGDKREIFIDGVSETQHIRTLLDYYERRNTSLENLITALQKSGSNHLAAKLMQSDVPAIVLPPSSAVSSAIDIGRQRLSSGVELNELLRQGFVPELPYGHVPRVAAVRHIRKVLENIKDEIGWVLVHGMGGCGKSVLCNEVLRDSHVLGSTKQGALFSSVMWLDIGRSPSKDEGLLLIRQKHLAVQLSLRGMTNFREFTSIAEGKTVLAAMIRQHWPRMLLVLDDIWSQEAVDAFDVYCRVLVTSRESTLINRVRSGKHHHVSMEKKPCIGFEQSQSLNLFSKILGCDTDSLNPQAKVLHKMAQGHPFLMSTMANILRDYPDRWNYLVQLLQRHRTEQMESDSGLYRTFNELIQESFNQLPTELQELYKRLSIFDNGMRIPGPVLETYWNMDKYTVEDKMDKIYKKSLLQCDKITYKDVIIRYYSLHDLVYGFISEKCDENTKKNFHKQLIKAYQRRCPTGYHELPFDYYIHFFLARHLKRADLNLTIKNAFLDLRFLRYKLEVCGATDTLFDFNKYLTPANLQDHYEQRLRNELQQFISVNACHFHSLFLGCNSLAPNVFTSSTLIDGAGLESALLHYDVIQMALLEPDESLVYQKANQLGQDILLRNSRALFVLYKNKLLKRVYHLSFKPQDSIFQIHYFPAANFCLSIGINQQKHCYYISNLNSTEILYKEYLTTTCQCASVNVNGEKIVVGHGNNLLMTSVLPHFISSGEKQYYLPGGDGISSWENKTPSPDEINKLPDFLSHFSKYVQTAAGTDNIDSYSDSAHSTSSRDSYDGEKKHVSKAHEQLVTWVAFSHDSRFIASCSDDKSVRIWQTSDLTCIHTLTNHTSTVSCCAWSMNDSCLVSTGHDWALCSYEARKGFALLHSWKPHISPIIQCCFITAGSLLNHVISLDSKNLCICDPLTGVQVQAVGLDDCFSAHCMDVSSSGAFVAVGLTTLKALHLILVINLKTMQILSTFEGHTSKITSLAISPNADRILSASDNATIMQWSVDGSLDGPPKSANGSCESDRILAFDVGFYSGQMVICTLNDKHMLVMRDASGAALYSSMPLRFDDKKPKIAMDLSDEATRGVLVVESGQIICFDFKIQKFKTDELNLREWRGRGKSNADEAVRLKMPPCLSSNGQRLLCHGRSTASVGGSMRQRQFVRVWDTQSTECEYDLEGHKGNIVRSRFLDIRNPDHIISVDYDGQIIVWQLSKESGDSNHILRRFSVGDGKYVANLDVSLPKQLISTAGSDGVMMIWRWNLDATKALLQSETVSDGDALSCVAFSNDARYLAVGSQKGVFKLYESTVEVDDNLMDCSNSYKLKREFLGHSDMVRHCQFSPDNQFLVSLDIYTIRWWDLQCLQPTQLLFFSSSTSSKFYVSPSFNHFVGLKPSNQLFILQRMQAEKPKVGGSKVTEV